MTICKYGNIDKDGANDEDGNNDNECDNDETDNYVEHVYNGEDGYNYD